MSPLQLLVISADLTGRLFIACKGPRGYLAWIASNMGLVFMYWETKQFALIALQFVNTGIQVMTLVAWRRAKRYNKTSPAQPCEAWQDWWYFNCR